MAGEIKNVYELLRVNKKFHPLPKEEVLTAKKAAEPVALPVAPLAQPVAEGEFTSKSKISGTERIQKKPGLLQRDFVKYPVIFVVSFGFFYFFLNFGAYSDKISAMFAKAPANTEPQKIEGRVLGVVTPDFQVWMKKYFYQVNASDAITPNVDYDCDGLTNYQEFQLGLNPTKADTNQNGYSDGQEVLNGYDPLGNGVQTLQEQSVVSGWDTQEISNRIAYCALSSVSTGPAAPSSLPAINYSFNAPGQISIPKIGVTAPVLWSNSSDNFTADLDKGVIHYPGTAYPGQLGLAYISGHSSNYIWSKSSYSHIFSRLNELQAGDEFFITVNNSEGDKVSLRYVVTDRREFQPDDQTQFSPSAAGDSEVNLSTCWPLGSTARRMVVSAKLTGV